MVEELHDGHKGLYVYCYCVARAGVPLDLSGMGSIVGGLPPYALGLGEVQAVLSRVPAAEYDEERLRANLRSTEWVEAAVLSHERVVEGCLHQTEVVPMKFCTLFRTEHDLVAALGTRREDLIRKLLDLAGKQEWGIRLVADAERLRRHLLDGDPELPGLRGGAASGSAGTAYFLKKLLEDRLERAMERARAEAASDGFARMAAASTRAIQSRAPGKGDLVLNAALLVTEEQLARLLGEVEQMVSERPWLRCEPSGPWPPYSFV